MVQVLNNEGIVDRTIRITIGLLGLGLVFIGPQWWWGAFGLIPLATGIAGYCPLYHLFHFSTCGSPHRIQEA